MRKLAFVVAGLLCVLLAGDFFLFRGSRINRRRVEHIDKYIAQRLPLGSTKSQVLAFLEEENIEHSFIDSGFELESVVGAAKLKPSQLGGIALSIIRDASCGYFCLCDTQFVFFFDKKSRLIKVSKWELGTAL